MQLHHFDAVDPVKPVAPYIGGKMRLAGHCGISGPSSHSFMAGSGAGSERTSRTFATRVSASC